MSRREKVTTAVTLPKDLLAAIAQLSDSHHNLSELIEVALRAYIAAAARRGEDARDLEIINQNAAALNVEALDVLDYQGFGAN